jgi:Domain of unknown function (DUF4328)
VSFLPPPPVPGAGAYVGPYATSSLPLPPMRSLRGLWFSILVLFALVGVADIFMAGAFLNRANLLDDVADGSFVFSELLDADDAVTTAVGAHVIVMIALAVTFIIWQFRHAKNAEALGERGGLGPAWAIGGWFIPIANYVLPAVQLHQSSRMSDPRVAGQPGAKGKGAPIVIVWAVLLALSAVVFISGGGLRPTDDEGNIQINSVADIDDAASGDRTAALGMVGFVAASIAGGMMVFSLSTKQATAYERRLAVPAAVPPPGAPFEYPTYGNAPPPPAHGQWGAPPPAPAPSVWAPPPPSAPAPPTGDPSDPTTQWGTPPP